MIEVMPAGIAEIRISEFVEVHRMMNPLCDDISLHVAREHDWQSVDWSDVAQWSSEEEDGQKIA